LAELVDFLGDFLSRFHVCDETEVRGKMFDPICSDRL